MQSKQTASSIHEEVRRRPSLLHPLSRSLSGDISPRYNFLRNLIHPANNMRQLIDIPRDDAPTQLFRKAGIFKTAEEAGLLGDQDFLLRLNLLLIKAGDLLPPAGTQVKIPPPEIMGFPAVKIPAGGKYHIQMRKGFWSLIAASVSFAIGNSNGFKKEALEAAIFTQVVAAVAFTKKLNEAEADVYDAVAVICERKAHDTNIMESKQATKEEIVEQLKKDRSFATAQADTILQDLLTKGAISRTHDNAYQPHYRPIS